MTHEINALLPVAVYGFTAKGLALAGRLTPVLASLGMLPRIHAPRSLRGQPDGQSGCFPLPERGGDHTSGPTGWPVQSDPPPDRRGQGQEQGVCRAPDQEPVWFDRIGPVMDRSFNAFVCHIFIGATGIAVRAIAPHLRGKERDPAVLAMDQGGRFVISLVSGHIGGANRLAASVAEALGAQAVISTATDVEDLPAVDQLAIENGLAIGSLPAAKAVSAALLAGKTVGLHDPDNRLGLWGSAWESCFRPVTDPESISIGPFPQVIVGVQAGPAGEAEGLPGPIGGHDHPRLRLYAKKLCVGVGCKRGASAEAIVDAIGQALAEAGLALEALGSLASAEIKSDEAGLLEAAARLRVPVRFFPAEVLSGYPVTRLSPKAKTVLGVDGVCEPSALAGADALAREGQGTDPVRNRVTGSSKAGSACTEAPQGPESPYRVVLLAGKRVFNQVTTAVAMPAPRPRAACESLNLDLI